VRDVALRSGGLSDERNHVVTVSPVIDCRYPRLIGRACEGDKRQQNQDGHNGPGSGHLAHLSRYRAARTLPRTRFEGTVPSLGPDGFGETGGIVGHVRVGRQVNGTENLEAYLDAVTAGRGRHHRRACGRPRASPHALRQRCSALRSI
jgi:hypothetical protein